MTIGKSISLFLIDGSTDGIVACELYNWTGKGYKIPRKHLKSVSKRDDIRKSGVYFLIGRDEINGDSVYIGEAEDVYKRLLQHQERDFWNECLVFISKDDNLNKAHAKYLEYTLYRSATETGRFKVLNTNKPNLPSISESDQAVMSEFSQNLRLLVGTLGYRIFENLTRHRIQKSEFYYISAVRGAKASGILTSEGMVVFKNSLIATSEVPSIPKAVELKRLSLQESGIIKDLQFSKDYLFSSPSFAAAVVMGRSANGLIEWKKADGSSMKENQPK